VKGLVGGRGRREDLGYGGVGLHMYKNYIGSDFYSKLLFDS